MTVDEILATGKYTDRRGRAWNYDPDFDVWVEYSSLDDGILHLGWIVDTKDVRLLIERDQHRDECPGLWLCQTHPVPGVFVSYNEDGLMYYQDTYTGRGYPDLGTALDSARALAVGE